MWCAGSADLTSTIPSPWTTSSSTLPGVTLPRKGPTCSNSAVLPFPTAVQPGMHVWTFGYPAPSFDTTIMATECSCWASIPRGLRNQDLSLSPRPGGPTLAHELDMQVPGGLSGAPIFLEGTDAILGVVFHAHEVETVESFSSVDPATGKRQPEIVRVIYFGLAYPLDVLLELRGPATNDRALAGCSPAPERLTHRREPCSTRRACGPRG